MICRMCGKEVVEGRKFCTRCGTPVKAVPARAAPGGKSSARGPKSPPPQSAKREKGDFSQSLGGRHTFSKASPESTPKKKSNPYEKKAPPGAYIFCDVCKTRNSPEASRCKKCRSNLLPSADLGILRLIPFAVGCGGVWVLYYIYQLGYILYYPFGLCIIAVAFWIALKPTRSYEKYMQRAMRHEGVSDHQVINDCTAALKCKDLKEGDDRALILKMRGDALNKLGRKEDARKDYDTARAMSHAG